MHTRHTDILHIPQTHATPYLAHVIFLHSANGAGADSNHSVLSLPDTISITLGPYVPIITTSVLLSKMYTWQNAQVESTELLSSTLRHSDLS